MSSTQVDIVITGNAALLEAAQKSATEAIDQLNAALAAQAAAGAAAAAADASSAAAKSELSAASKAAALAERELASASSQVEAAQASAAKAAQAAADRTARASAVYSERATAAQAAAAREAEALAAVAAAAEQSEARQTSAQRRLVAAQQQRASADAALTAAQAAVTAAAERGANEQAAAQAKVTAAQDAATAAALALASAHGRVTAAEREAAIGAAALASASEASAKAADSVAAARRREAAATAELSQARRAVETQQTQGQALLQSLQERLIMTEQGAAAYDRYKAAQLGVGVAAEQYISRLHSTTQAQGRAALTAGQLAQANRMLPMQMGDVAVSLASGMPLFMVFMQQGFQIKEAYGSVGNAVKATGDYILKMATNPVVLATAALATLAAAAWSASESHHALASAVAMSGNSVGLTTDQLSEMASGVATATSSTAGAASEAIAMLARSGSVVPEVMGLATEAALSLDRVGGQSVEDTAKAMARLGGDPVKAAMDLDRSFNFLTQATYEQATAAMDAGDKHEAARIVQEAYAKSAIKHSRDIESEMGTLRAYLQSVTDGAKSMWSAISGVGQSKEAGEIALLKEKAALGQITGAERDRLQALEAQGKAKQAEAQAENKAREQRQRKAEWDSKIKDGLTQYLPKAEREAKLAEKVANIRKQGALAGADQKEIDARVSQAQDAAKKIEESISRKNAPKKDKKETGQASQAQLFEQELSELKAALAEKNATEKTFVEFSKAEELKFWESKLSAVKAGSKEESSVRKKIADLKVAINKSEYESEIASLKKAESEAGKNAEQKLAMMQKTHAKIVQMYGKESEQAIQSAQRVAEAQKAAQEQAQQLAEISASRTDSLALGRIESERAAMDFELQQGSITKERKIAAEEEFQQRIYEIKRAALERQLALDKVDKDPVKYQQTLAKVEELEIQHTLATENIQRQKMAESQSVYKSFGDNVKSTLSQSMAGVLMGTQTIADGVRGLFSGVLSAGVNVLTELAAKEAINFAARQVKGAAAATAQVSQAAGVAGANALASSAAAPWPLNLSAPMVAAGMVAAVLGYQALASAEGGWWDTGSGDPLAQLHRREMVLPASVASPLRGAVSAMPALPAIAAQMPQLARRLAIPAAVTAPMQPRAQVAATSASSGSSGRPQGSAPSGGVTYNDTYHITVQGRGMDDAALARKIRSEIATIKTNRRPVNGK